MYTNIYYDGECPFCDNYVKLLKLREVSGKVQLINLRDDVSIRNKFESLGFNLDQGMVVDHDGKLYSGSDAVNFLALISTPTTVFNKINGFIFSNLILSRILYPLLRAGRWIVLFVLNRKGLLKDNQENLDRATVFSLFFGFFSVFHFFNYALEYGLFPPTVDLIFVLVAAIGLILMPSSPQMLALLMVVSTISAIYQAPVSSNHTILRNTILIGYWLSFLYSMFKGKSWGSVFDIFSLSGQGSLLVMYFYGIFHKINTDFLDPINSCAVFLWRLMPPPMVWIDNQAVHYMAIYGTFIVEGLLVVALLNKRWRHIGIVGGIGFHVLLALSSYAMYISFTSLTIALHSLFIGRNAASRIVNSVEIAMFKDRIRNPVYVIFIIVLVAFIFFAGLLKQYTLVTLAALPFILPLCYMVIRYGAETDEEKISRNKNAKWSIGVFVTLIFFANGFMPYLGLKSAQSINMFANLRLEAGVSNHLLISSDFAPFDYQKKVAKITDAGKDRYLEHVKSKGYGIVYYDLLNRFDKNPDLIASYTIDNKNYTNITSEDLKSDMNEILHPRWFRKWFHFQEVDLNEREVCGR